MNIGIIGLGYVGLVTAACLAELKNKVIGFDIDMKKLSKLRNRENYIFENGLDSLLKKNYGSNLKFTNNLEHILQDSETVFLCLPTPSSSSGKADLSSIKKSIKNIKSLLKKHKNKFELKNIVIKSTVPPGTNQMIGLLLGEENFDLNIISNPEFLSEGNAVNNFIEPDRIIAGINSEESIQVILNIYKNLKLPKNKYFFMNPTEAELTKYISNSFLASKISFMNEMARVSDIFGTDINKIRAGVGADSRIGEKFLNSGLGFGGSCFPKDLKALEQIMKSNKIRSPIISSIIDVNDRQPDWMIEKIKKFFGNSLKFKSVGVLGLSFKPNSDDIRSSMSIKLVEKLSSKVKEIVAFDPKSNQNSLLYFKDSGLNNIVFSDSKKDLIMQTDFFIIATEWEDFLTFNKVELEKIKQNRVIFDARNILDKDLMIKNGISYISLGR